MASEGQSEDAEHPAEPPTAPLGSNSTFRWGDIVAAVKDQLPSLDSDTSTVSTAICLSFSLAFRKKSLFIAGELD